MKEQMVYEVAAKLDQLHVPYTKGQSTDIAISCEFLDAGWSTGNKKINYDSFVFFDSENETVFMWECTKEIGSGFSMGSESESSFQSGTTLFRKVKSVQYGPEGQVYEYTLDLGAIPKAVKETAKTYGWKFKTVLKKEKALYPAGYGMMEEQDEMERKTPPPDNVTVQPSVHSVEPDIKMNRPNNEVKHKVLTGILMAVAFILILPCYAFLQVSILAWIFGAVTLMLFFVLARKVSSKGAIPIILIWILTMFIAFVILVFGASSEVLEEGTEGKNQSAVTSEEKAGLSKPLMAAEVDSVTMEPVEEVTSFATDTPNIYATALVSNAPENTKISAKWISVTDNYEAATSEVLTTEEKQYVAFQVTKPDEGFPVGEYKVELYVNDVLDETLEFVIE